MKRFFGLVKATMVAAVLGGLVSLSPAIGMTTDLLTIGSDAPALDVEHWVQNGEGKFGKVTKFEKDKVYVVEFWATWCGPCVASMPHIVETQKKYADKGVQIVSISDEPKDTVEEFLERKVPRSEKEMTFRDLTKSYCLTTDPDGSSNESYMQAAGQNGIPCAFIVGKDGKIEWIGHPMEMDEPLKSVVEGKWDRKAFADEFKEKQEMDALQMKVQREVGGLLRDKDFKGALAKFDELTGGIKNAEMKLQFTMMKLRLHQIANSEASEVSKTLKDALNMASSNPMMANQIAWTIWEMTEQGQIKKDKEILGEALKVAQGAAAKQEGQVKAATLDTVAHLHYGLGNLAEAIKAQKEAVSIVGDDPQIKGFLEELEEEAKSKK
ncbi:MAG: Thiol-disulfide oxidoreductase ResA [Planctomycetota bacterium]|jgi:thiol-disulfide isomerase/thioredoxin